MAESEIWHGGDLATAQALFPDAQEPWIDLSTGINPVPYPLPAIPPDAWQRLPGASQETMTLDAARAAYGVPDAAGIIAAPGTQILIELLPRLVGPGPVVILGQTYAEHEASWRRADACVGFVDDLDDVGDARIVVLVNPNNPDGRLVSTERLVGMAALLSARGGLLVVDEAFADFTPETSLIPSLPRGVLVLRSFGKTYGLAGLRLGFAVSASPLVGAFRDALGPWAVAGPALHVGAQALADAAWLAAAKSARLADVARLDGLLAARGTLVGGTALFRLLATPDAPALFAHLGRSGLYVRRFQHDATLLRFGLPGDEAAWSRLRAALTGLAGDSATQPGRAAKLLHP